MDKIHAYLFVYDSSNKRTFESMKCMLETIVELEKQKKKESGGKGGAGSKKKGSQAYYPKKMVVGNKKDLKKNKEAGMIKQDDVKDFPADGIKLKEISALTNTGINEVFKTLIEEMNNDSIMTKIQEVWAENQ